MKDKSGSLLHGGHLTYQNLYCTSSDELWGGKEREPRLARVWYFSTLLVLGYYFKVWASKGLCTIYPPSKIMNLFHWSLKQVVNLSCFFFNAKTQRGLFHRFLKQVVKQSCLEMQLIMVVLFLFRWFFKNKRSWLKWCKLMLESPTDWPWLGPAFVLSEKDFRFLFVVSEMAKHFQFVANFDQHLGAPHSKHWSKYFSMFFTHFCKVLMQK